MTKTDIGEAIVIWGIDNYIHKRNKLKSPW